MTPGKQLRNTVGLLPKVDVRAHGGYIVAPPSVHPSSAVYRWEVEVTRDTVADPPAWLTERLNPPRPEASRRSGVEWEQAVMEPVGEGRRNQALAQLAGLLFRHLPAKVAAELACCWARVKLRPPLPEPEVRRTIDSIARCELRRRGGTA